jgi:hypothetical protein
MIRHASLCTALTALTLSTLAAACASSSGSDGDYEELDPPPCSPARRCPTTARRPTRRRRVGVFSGATLHAFSSLSRRF